ncbi:hypothetical protein D3C72_1830590 [compost metagenome]
MGKSFRPLATAAAGSLWMALSARSMPATNFCDTCGAMSWRVEMAENVYGPISRENAETTL